jgi:hypothetical protein
MKILTWTVYYAEKLSVTLHSTWVSWLSCVIGKFILCMYSNLW